MKSFLIIVSLFFIISSSFAQSPTLSLQGVLRDNNGAAVDDGQYSMTFRFYDAESDGTALSWSESHTDVTVVNGTYNVILGSKTAFDLPFDEAYYLSVEVDGTVMEPRIPLTLAPYSLSVRGTDNVFPSSGDVGIGITEPDADLHILETGVDDAELILSKENQGFIHMVAGTDVTEIRANRDINIMTNNYERITVKDDGYVGIGTTGPSHKMDIRGGLRVDMGSSYDVWIQGGPKYNHSDDNRNLALLGEDENNGDRLIINYNGEYASGVEIQSNAKVTKDLTVNDDIKTNDGLWVPVALDANLKILSGFVDENGGIVRGAGFSATRSSEGIYKITFNTAFRYIPVAVASPAETDHNSKAVDNTVGISDLRTTGFTLNMVDIDGTSNGDKQDCSFTFIVFGVK